MSQAAKLSLFVGVFTPIHAGLTFFVGLWAYSSFGKPGGELPDIFLEILLTPMKEIAQFLPSQFAFANQFVLVGLNSLVWGICIGVVWIAGQGRKGMSCGFTVTVKRNSDTDSI